MALVVYNGQPCWPVSQIGLARCTLFLTSCSVISACFPSPCHRLVNVWSVWAQFDACMARFLMLGPVYSHPSLCLAGMAHRQASLGPLVPFLVTSAQFWSLRPIWCHSGLFAGHLGPQCTKDHSTEAWAPVSEGQQPPIKGGGGGAWKKCPWDGDSGHIA